MMEDLRSPKVKARAERDYRRWSVGLRTAEKRRKALAAKVWAKGAPWQPIESCPFKDFEYKPILVTDGKSVALAKPHKRFGTPMRWEKPPTLAMTDHGMSYVGGKLAKIKAPKWWFQWELTDEFGTMNYAGGEETGKNEVGFIATHWMPFPTPFRKK
jgi:hypothetical protein